MATKQELILCGVDVEMMSERFLKVLEEIPIIELQQLLIDKIKNYDISLIVKKLEEIKIPDPIDFNDLPIPQKLHHHWYRKKGNR